ncbi:unnamed protein product [Adineta ricciae]|uniref:G-protein coupled receptors family 1 profile domain-containing protein n=1 Tax=Adineta ricciae TaxID=249248 RepID=A0A814C2K2_ADIRI|nr:unnamed protein product [Adineta ricciae]CAF1458052.1 unnamed protein product [Adineta ricciae]
MHNKSQFILKIWFHILSIYGHRTKGTEVPYNQPKLPGCPQWDSHGITFAKKDIIGTEPLDIFVDRNNTVFAIDMSNKEAHIWNAGNITPTTLILDNYLEPWGLFVTNNGDIYIGTGADGCVKKWRANRRSGTMVMNVSSYCAGLFVDTANYLYCSLGEKHQVVKQSLVNNTNTLIIVAGSHTQGTAAKMLHGPRGIFVDINFDLYVADCFNHRIQLFKFENLIGTTVVDSARASNINLRYPTAVLLDADRHLFIVDNGNHRIVRLLSTGLHCIAGCSGVVGSTSSHLHYPYAAAFDSHGNIFVADQNNNRIQKFMLLLNTSNSIGHSEIVMESSFSSELTISSRTFRPSGCGTHSYYYQAIQLNVIENGCYNLVSNNTISTYGYIYRDDFNPFNPAVNLFLQNYQSYHNHQFKFQTYLQINTTYILVVSTSNPNVTGMFAVLAVGPHRINFNPLDTEPIIQSLYQSILTINSHTYRRERCKSSDVYYEAIQINVITSGFYSFSSESKFDAYGSLYKHYFDPFDIRENFIIANDDGCVDRQFVFIAYLHFNTTYVLVMTTFHSSTTGIFSIRASGAHKVIFNRIMIQSTYASELNAQTEVYSRVCGRTSYHYQTIEVNVQESGAYSFDSNSTIVMYGYIYESAFDPFNPTENVLSQSGYDCDGYHFHFATYLRANTIYILLMTTFHPDIRGSFSVLVSGPNNISLNRINKRYTNCVIGDRCNFYTKGIGLTLDDILRNEFQSDTTLYHQSVLVKTSAALTIIMFIGGFISAILSFLTFLNKDLRKVGCGIYLIASSVTSLLTISLFTVKFWFLLLTETTKLVNLSTYWGGCMFIEPFLKICVYLNAWVNACVAVERAINVSKGIRFDKKKSAYIARWILVILPLVVIGTIVHEPMYRNLFEYTSEVYKLAEYEEPENSTKGTAESLEKEPEISGKGINESIVYETEKHVLCVTNYSHTLQNYNTFILFFHLLIPFMANLFSALCIIFGIARQQSVIRNGQTYRQHLFEQFNEHKQLIISPVILLILSSPRLIISLISGCVNASSNPWLYIVAYFISFTPSILVFVVFVLPSELYMKSFKKLFQNFRPQVHQ